MNRIKRARRRPRVNSYSFRTLWWVLAREAVVQVMRAVEPEPDEDAIRELVVDWDGTQCRLWMETQRYLHPWAIHTED